MCASQTYKNYKNQEGVSNENRNAQKLEAIMPDTLIVGVDSCKQLDNAWDNDGNGESSSHKTGQGT